MLKVDRYKVLTKTKGKWIVRTLAGEKIMFKKDTGVYRGIPYIDLCEHIDWFPLIETI